MYPYIYTRHYRPRNKRRYLVRDGCSMLRADGAHWSFHMDREVVEGCDSESSSKTRKRRLNFARHYVTGGLPRRLVLLALSVQKLEFDLTWSLETILHVRSRRICMLSQSAIGD